jgi:hypothetical protein
MSAETYHIDIKRWLAEMAALRLALEIGRKDVCIVRYEDMVTDAERVQRKIGDELGLEAGTSVEDMATVFRPSDEAKSAMHGLRRIDTRSLHRYKDDPNKLAYLKTIKPQLGDTLDWVASRFGYDTSLT